MFDLQNPSLDKKLYCLRALWVSQRSTVRGHAVARTYQQTQYNAQRFRAKKNSVDDKSGKGAWDDQPDLKEQNPWLWFRLRSGKQGVPQADTSFR